MNDTPIISTKMNAMWDDVEKQLLDSGYAEGDVTTALFSMTRAASNELSLYHNITNCTNCGLYKQCSGPVHGMGVNRSPIMIVAEAPGEHEDRYGLPLIGPSGALLNLVLGKLDVDRSELYITNAVKCHPPQNREPVAEELAACEDHLFREIQVVNPKFIVTLGNVAMRMLRGDNRLKITEQRGKFVKYTDCNGDHAVMHTFHPSFVLRQKGDALTKAKWEFWNDLDTVMTAARRIVPDYNLTGGLKEMESDGTNPGGTDAQAN